MNPVAFTLEVKRSNAIQLITPCDVSIAYDSNFTPNIPHPKFVRFRALWDTGASGCVITDAVIDALNLKPIRQVEVYDASGSKKTNLYFVNILLPNNIEFKNLPVTSGVLKDFDVLIGMDVICNGDFSITNRDKDKVLFSFQIPSTHEYDFVKQISNGVGLKKKNKKKK